MCLMVVSDRLVQNNEYVTKERFHILGFEIGHVKDEEFIHGPTQKKSETMPVTLSI